MKRKVALAATAALSLYGLFAWVYIAIISIVQPATLHLQLTHFAPFPHDDTFGEASFVISFVSFFCYTLLRHQGAERSAHTPKGP